MEQEQKRQYWRDYYQKNKDKLKDRQKKYRQANPERVREVKQKSHVKHLAKRKRARGEWLKTLKGYLAYKVYHLKKKNKAFEIDVDFLLELWKRQEGRCSISGYPMTFGENTLFGVSVDRIDSSEGYTKNNVQLVCQAINFAKNRYSNEQILEFWNFRDKLKKGGENGQC